MSDMTKTKNATGDGVHGRSWIAALVVLFIALFVQERNDFAPLDTLFPPLTINSTVEEHFVENYYQARALFRQRTQDAGAKLYTLPLPELAHLDLTIDVAVIDGAKDHVLLHVSGTHGVEGFAGSAIQSAILQRTKEWKKKRGGATVILVHALNPYGFSQLRRFNEHNVDLNRNYLSPEEFKERMAMDPNKYGYVDAYNILNPQPNESWNSWFWAKVVVNVASKGYSAIKQATVSGNYHFPQTVFFGGQEKQPSLVLLDDFLKHHVALEKLNGFGFVDVHTGLGKAGIDTLITVNGTNASALSSVFHDEITSNQVAGTADSSNDVVDGYATVAGLIGEGLGKALPAQSHSKNIMVCQEFGTVPGVFVFKAITTENAFYHYAPTRRLLYGEKLRDVFYVHRSASWKQSVFERGLIVFRKLYDHLS